MPPQQACRKPSDTASNSPVTESTNGRVWRADRVPIAQESTLGSPLSLTLTHISANTTTNCAPGMQHSQNTESRDTADKNKRGGQTPSPRSYSCCRPVLCTLGYLYQHQELRSISHCPLQGIFPTQGSNPGLSHCRWILCHLSHQGTQTNKN